MSHRDRVIRQWTPRVGDGAARKVMTVLYWRLVMVVAVIVLVLSVLDSRIIGQPDVTFVVLPPYFLSWAVGAVGLRRARVAARRAADDYLQIPHGDQEPPPVENLARFDSWKRLMIARQAREAAHSGPLEHD